MAINSDKGIAGSVSTAVSSEAGLHKEGRVQASAGIADLGGVQASAQTSMPGVRVSGSEVGTGKDEDKEREAREIVKKCNEIAGKIARSSNPAEIEGLIAQLNALAAHAESLGIKVNVAEVVSEAGRKENSASAMAGVAGESGQDAARETREAAAREKLWDNDPARGEWTQAKVDAAYKEFYKFKETYAKKQHQKNKDLDDALSEMDAGKPPSEETKKKLKLKTPEEIKAAKEEVERVKKAKEAAEKDHEYHAAAHKAAEEEHAKLEAEKQRHEQDGNKEAVAKVHGKMAGVKHKVAYHAEHMEKAKAVKAEVAIVEHGWQQEAQKIKSGVEKADKNGDPKWKEAFAGLAEEHRGVHGKTVDEMIAPVQGAALDGSASPMPAQKPQEAQNLEIKSAAPRRPALPQIELDSPHQQLKNSQGKEGLGQELKNVMMPTPPIPEAKKQEKGAQSPQKIAVKGASIINSTKENATVKDYPPGAQVKPEGGAVTVNKKDREIDI